MTYSRPLLIIGNGARGLDWTKFGIPIVTTRLGIDLIESDHPLFAGRYGLFTDTPSYLAVKNADLVICVGARLDPGFAGYNFKDFAPQATIFIVDIDQQELNKFGKNTAWIKGLAKDFYSHLPFIKFGKDKKVFLKDIDSIKWLDQIHTWQKKYPLKLTGSYKVIREISDQATKDDVIVVDTSLITLKEPVSLSGYFFCQVWIWSSHLEQSISFKATLCPTLPNFIKGK